MQNAAEVPVEVQGEIISLSQPQTEALTAPSTVDSISVPSSHPLLVEEKREASTAEHYAHLALETEAATFAAGFISVNSKVAHRLNSAKSGFIKVREYVADNDDLITRIRFFFAHIKRGQSLMGCTTFDAFAKEVLHSEAHYIRQVQAGIAAMSDGTKLRLAKTPAEQAAAKEKSAALKAKKQADVAAVPAEDFSRNLGNSVTESIDGSVYSKAVQAVVAAAVSAHLKLFADALAKEAATEAAQDAATDDSDAADGVAA